MNVKDPALFVFAFFDRHLPGHVEHDPREVFRCLFRSVQELYELSERDPACRVQDIEELNLVHIAQAEHGFIRWINRLCVGPEKGLRQALSYTFGDTLFLHALDSRGGTSCEFASAWNELSSRPKAAFGECDWKAAGDGFWGLNCCYSVLLPDTAYQRLSPDDVRLLISCISDTAPLMTQTKVGQLWLAGSEWMGLRDIANDLKATWVMISPKSAERELQKLFHDIAGPTPPEFPLLVQARHKFYVQLAQYGQAEGALRGAHHSLDKRMDWMITAQRDYEEIGQVIGAEEAEELRQKTSRAHTNFAAFEQAVTRVDEVQSTLGINLRNYQERSSHLLTPDGEDHILKPEQSYMGRRAEQIAYDSSYFAALLRRARATLEAAQARISISKERQQAQGVRFGVTQVSGLVASLMALVVTEVFSLSDFAQKRPVLATNLILFALVGSFAVAQLLLAWGRIRAAIMRFTLAGAGGLMATTLLGLASSGSWELWYGLAAAGVFLLVFGSVYTLVRFLEEAPRRNLEPAWRRLRGFTFDIEKLRLASEELADLLDDLPPTRLYRLKGETSFEDKIVRKNRERAEELRLTPEELVQRGLAYTERDIGDAIGIRYVVSPWELPIVVERVKRVLGPRVERIEYKKGRYKSVHIDVDLWGVGAKRDLNLMAEVQVRTYLQDFYANSVHDVIYKDVPGSGLWLLRLLKRWRPTRWTLPLWDRLLALPSDVELRLFRRWMRWG
jgi:hypothetical protein